MLHTLARTLRAARFVSALAAPQRVRRAADAAPLPSTGASRRRASLLPSNCRVLFEPRLSRGCQRHVTCGWCRGWARRGTALRKSKLHRSLARILVAHALLCRLPDRAELPPVPNRRVLNGWRPTRRAETPCVTTCTDTPGVSRFGPKLRCGIECPQTLLRMRCSTCMLFKPRGACKQDGGWTYAPAAACSRRWLERWIQGGPRTKKRSISSECLRFLEPPALQAPPGLPFLSSSGRPSCAVPLLSQPFLNFASRLRRA